MKIIGLATGGVGAAAAAAPVFHDFDEMMSAAAGWEEPMPWWVSKRDAYDATVEVDWNVLEPYNRDNMNNYSAHITPEKRAKWSADQLELRKAKILADFPGHRLQDIGLNLAGRAMRGNRATGAYGRAQSTGGLEPLGLQREDVGLGTSPFTYYAEEPHERGVPRYEGTPEENTLMMACISRYVGGTQTSFSELDERGRKFMWKRNSLVYDDGPAFHPYYDEAARQYHIPKALRYMVNPIIQQDIGGTRRPPTNYSGLNVGKGYMQSALANIRLHAFIRTLGWHSYGANSAAFNTAYAVMSGAGEVLRLHEACSPYVGPLFRRANMFLTDLPLVATTPIDSGITKFCESCLKCANLCPTQAIPYHKEPSWDITPADSPGGEPDFLDPTRFNQPGKKIWFLNLYACRANWTFTDTGCGICQGTCVFSKAGAQSIHGLVRGFLATTPIFNSFLTNMDETFGYGNVGYDPDFPNPGSFIPGGISEGIKYSQRMADEYNSWWDKPRPIFGLNY
jgi:reductive dehalogenase